MLLRLVPTQGEQDFLALSRSSQGGCSDELPIRLKENRYMELLRAGNSLKNQERLHFQAMTCGIRIQRELLLGLLDRIRRGYKPVLPEKTLSAWPPPSPLAPNVQCLDHSGLSS